MYGADTLNRRCLSLTCRDSGWAIRVERAVAGLQKIDVSGEEARFYGRERAARGLESN
jgi:hypothetical protein